MSDRTITFEREFLVRKIQRYTFTAPAEKFEGKGEFAIDEYGDVPWQLDQAVCDGGTLIEESEDLLNDDELQYRIIGEVPA